MAKILFRAGASGLTRRTFLRGAGLVAAPALVGCTTLKSLLPQKADPFQLGVAAGSPTSDGFVIWTRLAPDPMHADPAAPGGMTGGPRPVSYEIAADEAMRTIVRRGQGIADPNYAYSVHVELAGLKPGRPYWYRFIHGDAVSRTGIGRTLPAAGAPLDGLRFGFVSCSNYEQGYFSAYRHLADEQPEHVLFLGDYIYEYFDKRPGKVRQHSGGKAAETLPEYRNRYAQYRQDADLQRLHAEAPGIFTWDDHEVQNDYQDGYSGMSDEGPATFLKRRAAAYQAYYEHMPLKPSLSRPDGPNLRIYDRFAFGDLVELSMLDGRQYRSREACAGHNGKWGGHQESPKTCPELMDPKRTFLGDAQEAWLYEGLAKSKARWNIIGQDQLVAQFKEMMPDGSTGYWVEDWNGYPAARQRLMQHIHDSEVSNPLVVGGDIHAYFANDLKLDFNKPKSPTVATEFVGTSITSYPAPYETFAKTLSENPDIRFFESRVRGYATVDIVKNEALVRFRSISDAKDPNATVSTFKSFIVADGKPGVVEA
jgi:alkaline phosphatase D